LPGSVEWVLSIISPLAKAACPADEVPTAENRACRADMAGSTKRAVSRARARAPFANFFFSSRQFMWPR
jgi:hypothetical protein